VHKINSTCLDAGLSATARAIHHDIDFMNRKLETGHYFFTDIVSEGRMLYDDGTLELAEKKTLTPAERLEIVEDDFDNWYQGACRFFEHYKIDREKLWLKMAAFHLHQAAEAAYKTTLIVFTGYIPDEHYLAILGQRVAKIDPALWEVFKSEDRFESEAFIALEYAYIGARYDKRYTIDEPSLAYLAGRVETLMKLTQARCREKITALQRAAAD
jgi:HEPN domain-containing protein